MTLDRRILVDVGTRDGDRLPEGYAPALDGTAGVSFVISLYNKRLYLPAVVEGLARQRGDFPREFIFVDDGSADGSAEEVERLTAEWPSVRILRQPNRGPSVATNRGLTAARYPLVKVVDGDDVLLPNATGMLRDALIRHPRAVLAFGAGEGYGTPGEALARVRAAPYASASTSLIGDPLPSLLRNCYLAPSICLLRTDTAREVGGCDERIFTQDYSLFLRLAARGAFVGITATTALGPIRAPARVNDGGPQVLHDVNLTLLYFLSEHAIPAAIAKEIMRRAVKRAWHWARRRENARSFASSSLLLLLAHWPRPGVSLELLRRSCAAFASSRPVRRM